MVRHPLFARVYARMPADEISTAHRRELLAGLSGAVLELGAGNGMNFPHYPAAVTRLVAVEPEPYLRARALEASADDARIEVVDGEADALPTADAGFDAAVTSLVLCSVPDQARALAELRRVLRPGGELRFYEHVKARSAPGATLQRAADLVWPRIAGGCHAARDTLAAIAAAGFAVERVRGFRHPPGFPTPVTPHVLGAARAA